MTAPAHNATMRHSAAWRTFSGVAAMLLASAATTGCRHRTQVAYQPPPPPVTTVHTAPRTSANSGSPGIKPSAATPMSPENTASAGFDDTSGAPVSVEFGLASWYGPPYNHRASADGTIFDQNAMTAAHRTLPMGSTVRVTNVASGQSVLVRITDRGPFSPGRVLDLSLGAAKAIGVWRPGTAQVKIEAFAHASSNPAGKWCVQVGAFKRQDDALDLKTELFDRYRTAKIIEFAGPTGYWVRINPATPDLAHANQVAHSLSLADPNAAPYVVRID